MKTLISRYCHLYEHEKFSNATLLAMIDSVPTDQHRDPRFQQALNLAAHLAACRENWLDRMVARGENQVPWFEEAASRASLTLRFQAVEHAWTAYLASLDDDDLQVDFEFPLGNGQRFRWYVEGQILQLIGHGNYHRAQIALLVDQLGGKTVDTDYLFWACGSQGNYQKLPSESH